MLYLTAGFSYFDQNVQCLTRTSETCLNEIIEFHEQVIGLVMSQHLFIIIMHIRKLS